MFKDDINTSYFDHKEDYSRDDLGSVQDLDYYEKEDAYYQEHDSEVHEQEITKTTSGFNERLNMETKFDFEPIFPEITHRLRIIQIGSVYSLGITKDGGIEAWETKTGILLHSNNLPSSEIVKKKINDFINPLRIIKNTMNTVQEMVTSEGGQADRKKTLNGIHASYTGECCILTSQEGENFAYLPKTGHIQNFEKELDVRVNACEFEYGVYKQEKFQFCFILTTTTGECLRVSIQGQDSEEKLHFSSIKLNTTSTKFIAYISTLKIHYFKEEQMYWTLIGTHSGLYLIRDKVLPSQTLQMIFQNENKEEFKQKVEKLKSSPNNNQRRDIAIFYSNGDMRSLIYTDYEKIYYFSLPENKKERLSNMTTKFKPLPYFKRNSKARVTENVKMNPDDLPLDVFISEFHYFVLFRKTLNVISLHSKELVAQPKLSFNAYAFTRQGSLVINQPKGEDFQMKIFKMEGEANKVWMEKLEKKQFKRAFEICRDHLPQHVERVGNIYANYLINAKSFGTAVDVLSQIECPFQDIAIRLMDESLSNEKARGAFFKFVRDKVEKLQKQERKTEVTILVSWLVEHLVYTYSSFKLQMKMLTNQLNSKMIQNMGAYHKTLIDVLDIYHNKVDTKTIFQILTSHGCFNECLSFAEDQKQYLFIFNHNINEKNHMAAANALNSLTLQVIDKEISEYALAEQVYIYEQHKDIQREKTKRKTMMKEALKLKQNSSLSGQVSASDLLEQSLTLQGPPSGQQQQGQGQQQQQQGLMRLNTTMSDTFEASLFFEASMQDMDIPIAPFLDGVPLINQDKEIKKLLSNYSKEKLNQIEMQYKATLVCNLILERTKELLQKEPVSFCNTLKYICMEKNMFQYFTDVDIMRTVNFLLGSAEYQGSSELENTCKQAAVSFLERLEMQLQATKPKFSKKKSLTNSIIYLMSELNDPTVMECYLLKQQIEQEKQKQENPECELIIDFDFVMQICSKDKKFSRCKIVLYGFIDQIEEAVTVSIESNHLDLAKKFASQHGVDNNRLWLKIALDYIRRNFNNDYIKKEILEDPEGRKYLKIEDLIPYFDQSTRIYDFSLEISKTLQNYNESITTFKEDIKRFQKTELNIRKQEIIAQNQYYLIKDDTKCSECDDPILENQVFYIFPCQHVFHRSCLITVARNELIDHQEFSKFVDNDRKIDAILRNNYERTGLSLKMGRERLLMEVFGHGDLTHIMGSKMLNKREESGATEEVVINEDEYDVPDLYTLQEKNDLLALIEEQCSIVAKECLFCGYTRVEWIYGQFKGNRDDWRIY